MKIISLGFRCNIAQNLERDNLRNESNLFDWDFTLSMGTITNILQSLHIYQNYYKFTNYTNDHVDEQFGSGKDVKNLMLVNNKYDGLIHRHFDLSNRIHQIKYRRRINRLINTLNSKEPIIFIRQLHDGNVYDRLKKCNIILRYNLHDINKQDLTYYIYKFFYILSHTYHRDTSNDWLLILADKKTAYKPIHKNVKVFYEWELLSKFVNELLSKYTSELNAK